VVDPPDVRFGMGTCHLKQGREDETHLRLADSVVRERKGRVEDGPGWKQLEATEMTRVPVRRVDGLLAANSSSDQCERAEAYLSLSASPNVCTGAAAGTKLA
jgi:hypothetical protein